MVYLTLTQPTEHFFFLIKIQQAIPGSSALTNNLMEPHLIGFLRSETSLYYKIIARNRFYKKISEYYYATLKFKPSDWQKMVT